MANKKLNSITFPNLPNDTYYLDADKVHYNAADTYADGSTGKALQNKAEIDGYYENLGAGTADNLATDIRANDKVPYNFRTSGGSVDIGDREYINAITGGSLAWNQLMKDPSLATQASASKGSFSASNGVGTITADGSGNAYATLGFTAPSANHVVLMSCDVMLDSSNVSDYASTVIMTSWTGGHVAISNATKGTWKTIATVVKPTATPSAFAVYPFGSGLTTASGEKAYIKNPIYVDLTQMFGSAIADYIYALETNHAGDGVAFFRKLFPKPYYAYDSGSIQSVKTSKHKTVGFNQWDEEWEQGGLADNGGDSSQSTRIRSKNYIPILPSTSYYWRFGTNGGLKVLYYDADKNLISYAWVNPNTVQTSPANAYYARFSTGDAYGGTYRNDICINLSWDGSRNGEYEPYEAHEYALDSDLTLRGIPKLDANNSLYYDGDVYESDGTVTRKYGIVDLGTLEWGYASDTAYPRFTAQLSDIKSGSPSVVSNIVCSKYKATYTNDIYSNGADKSIGVNTTYLWIRDTAYTDAATFKTAMSGVYLVYELATPTTETADSYQSPQIVDDFGTEEYVDTRDVAIPVGHDTDYPVDLKAKLEMAPNSPDGDGVYVVKQTSGTNEYVPLVIPSGIPSVPSTDGAYVLTATVSSGTTTLTWEAQE